MTGNSWTNHGLVFGLKRENHSHSRRAHAWTLPSGVANGNENTRAIQVPQTLSIAAFMYKNKSPESTHRFCTNLHCCFETSRPDFKILWTPDSGFLCARCGCMGGAGVQDGRSTTRWADSCSGWADRRAGESLVGGRTASRSPTRKQTPFFPHAPEVCTIKRNEYCFRLQIGFCEVGSPLEPESQTTGSAVPSYSPKENVCIWCGSAQHKTSYTCTQLHSSQRQFLALGWGESQFDGTRERFNPGWGSDL